MGTYVTAQKAAELSSQGYTWDGHTHVGDSKIALRPSSGDMAVLKAFNQCTSVIYNSVGQYQTFADVVIFDGDMASEIAIKYNTEIECYCNENGLSYEKMCSSPCCYDNEELIILYDDGTPERRALGLLDGTPMPATLVIYLENGNIRFEQTDITHKYLGAH